MAAEWETHRPPPEGHQVACWSAPGGESWLGPWPALTPSRPHYSPGRRDQWDQRSQEGRAGLPAEVECGSEPTLPPAPPPAPAMHAGSRPCGGGCVQGREGPAEKGEERQVAALGESRENWRSPVREQRAHLFVGGRSVLELKLQSPKPSCSPDLFPS